MNRVLVFIIYLFLFACANVGSPSGGPRDETPPKLDTLGSTENFQTNFEKQRIQLTFDEFVDLKDVFNQVVVSPPLAKRPSVTKKKRTIRFDFDKDEVLREDATYTINFGEAVRDFTEGNPAENLRFVFSTGDFIDSLEVRGKISDALTGEPSAEVLLMLYDNLSDTVVRKERPFYFAKTGEDGQYQIGNIKSDTFKVFALFDSNLNYRYDQESELIGFPDENIILSGDSNLIIPSIRLFQEDSPLKIIGKKLSNGLVKLTYNQRPENIDFEYDAALENVSYEYDADTISFWYDWKEASEWKLFINKDTLFYDTIEVKSGNKDAYLKNGKFRPILSRKNQINKFNPKNGVKLNFNHPIAFVDTSKIYFYEDSTFVPLNPTVDYDQRELHMNLGWKEDSIYQLQILPSGITDIYGLTNSDTISQQYKASNRKDFGNIIVTVNGLDSMKNYVLHLVSQNNSKLVEEILIKELKTYNRTFIALNPGSYEIKIITDLNENGRWDTGNYEKRLQPEPIFTVKTKELRANWDIEEEINLVE